MRKLLSEAAERAVRYLEGLDSRGVAPVAGAIELLKKWDEPLPDGPTDPETVVALLDEIGSPATMAMAGPRFFGFVIGRALPAALGANWLAGAWDQNTALSAVTPGTALLERIALRWLLDVLGLPPTCGRLPGPQRGRPQSGAGLLRRPGDDNAGHRGYPGGWHLLVRRDGVARARRDAHQRLLLGHDRGRR